MSSEEIIDMFENIYPDRMKRSFYTQEDAEYWLVRKCENFEKIFERTSLGRVRFDKLVNGRDATVFILKGSDKDVFFKFVITHNEKNVNNSLYNCSFEWGLV